MRHKLTLILIVALVALTLPTSVKQTAAVTSPGHAAKPLTLGVGVYCLFLGRNRDECHADVDGGTSPYTFQWSPTPLSGGGGSGIAIIGCLGTAIQTISVTVTDANSDTGSFPVNFSAAEVVTLNKDCPLRNLELMKVAGNHSSGLFFLVQR